MDISKLPQIILDKIFLYLEQPYLCGNKLEEYILIREFEHFFYKWKSYSKKIFEKHYPNKTNLFKKWWRQKIKNIAYNHYTRMEYMENKEKYLYYYEDKGLDISIWGGLSERLRSICYAPEIPVKIKSSHMNNRSRKNCIRKFILNENIFNVESIVNKFDDLYDQNWLSNIFSLVGDNLDYESFKTLLYNILWIQNKAFRRRPVFKFLSDSFCKKIFIWKVSNGEIKICKHELILNNFEKYPNKFYGF